MWGKRLRQSTFNSWPLNEVSRIKHGVLIGPCVTCSRPEWNSYAQQAGEDAEDYRLRLKQSFNFGRHQKSRVVHVQSAERRSSAPSAPPAPVSPSESDEQQDVKPVLLAAAYQAQGVHASCMAALSCRACLTGHAALTSLYISGDHACDKHPFHCHLVLMCCSFCAGRSPS